MKLIQGHIKKNMIVLARVLLAFVMFVAIVFRSLPDSVFDHFHDHEHGVASMDEHPSVGNYKHNCHIEDWNFESFEVTHHHYQYPQNSATVVLTLVPFETFSHNIPSSTGRAPPIA